MMTLLETLQKDKLALIAMNTLVKDCSTGLGLDLTGSVSGLCVQAKVNRTHVYEKRRHIQGVLASVALSGPGRPPALPRAEAPDAKAGALREKGLRYRLAHPGAVVNVGTGQLRYSTGFKRTLLDWADSSGFGFS